MKKRMTTGLVALVLAATTGMTYAASPSFSDVPTKHWAYDAVTKLAKAGLVDGYGDGTFRGDKSLNRYEFAVMVEKAIAKYESANDKNKELIDKLSAEFAGELNRMGARVTKLEAKTSALESKMNITVGGDTRMRFASDSPAAGTTKKLDGGEKFDFRQRIKFSGKVNDDISWVSRVSTQYGNKFGSTASAPLNGESPIGSVVYLDMMTVTAKNVAGIDSVRAGRSALDFFGNGLMGKPMSVDGILVNEKLGDFAFRGWTGNIKTGGADSKELTTGDLTYKVSPDLTLKAGYYWADIPGDNTTMNVKAGNGSFTSSQGWSTSVVYKFGKHTLLADYISSSLDNTTGSLSDNPKGWSVQISNGEGPGAKAVYYPSALLVNPAKTGTDAWSVSYRSVDAGALPSGAGGFDTTVVANGTPANINPFMKGTDNVNVLFLTYQKVLAKNTVISLEYQDFKLKDNGLAGLASDKLDKTYMAKFEFFY